jgi:TRAP-type C4-dicarboxylate transport system permease small subunit
MEKLLRVVFGVSKALNDFAAVALTFMVATTVIDVCFRAIGHPFLGAYEIVGPICGPLVIGFALPLSSWNRNHISIDIFLPKNEQMIRITATSTRIVCMLLFGFIGYNLFSLGNEFRTSSEVTQTIHLPFFWVTYGLGICCFFECIVFICDIIKIWRGKT